MKRDKLASGRKTADSELSTFTMALLWLGALALGGICVQKCLFMGTIFGVWIFHFVLCMVVLYLKKIVTPQWERFRDLCGRQTVRLIGQVSERLRSSAGKLDGLPRGSFVLLVVPARSREHLVGDLLDEYRTVVAERGPRYARRWWWRQVLGIVGPYIRKRIAHALGLEFARRWRRR